MGSENPTSRKSAWPITAHTSMLPPAAVLLCGNQRQESAAQGHRGPRDAPPQAWSEARAAGRPRYLAVWTPCSFLSSAQLTYAWPWLVRCLWRQKPSPCSSRAQLGPAVQHSSSDGSYQPQPRKGSSRIQNTLPAPRPSNSRSPLPSPWPLTLLPSQGSPSSSYDSL